MVSSVPWCRASEASLLELVRCKPFLWDNRDPLYHKTKFRQKAFKDVAEQLQAKHPELTELNGADVRQKFKNLRTYFLACHNKLKNGPSGSEGSPRKKWPLFDSATFLVDSLVEQIRISTQPSFYLPASLTRPEKSSTLLKDLGVDALKVEVTEEPLCGEGCVEADYDTCRDMDQIMEPAVDPLMIEVSNKPSEEDALMGVAPPLLHHTHHTRHTHHTLARDYHRAKKDYTRQKAEKAKTGGGPPAAPAAPVSAAVLPLLEDELELLKNTFDCDQRNHDQTVIEDADDGSVTLSVSAPREPLTPEASNSVTCIVTCHGDNDDDGGPTETRNAIPSIPIRQRPAIKRKLSHGKEEALRLTERSRQLCKMDLEVHQKRLELLEHEKMLKTEHFRSLQELQDLQKKCLLEYHEKKMAQLE